MRKVIFIILFLPIFMCGQTTITICDGDEYSISGKYDYAIYIIDIHGKERKYQWNFLLIR